MTTPDHVENTGDNLRHAAEVQEEARDIGARDVMSQGVPETPLPASNP